MNELIQFCLSWPVASTTIMAVLGVLIGSFLNVVISRLPRMMYAQWLQEAKEITETAQGKSLPSSPYNLCVPRSHCTSCQKSIPFYHNIPIVSFMVLRGRCHFCQETISWRYPVIEILSGIMLVSLYLLFGCSLQTLGYAVLRILTDCINLH